MKTALLESPRETAPEPQIQQRGTAIERQISIDQLARAVGEHALCQAEIDQRMVRRIIELRDELSAAKGEIDALRSQMNQLIQGLSQGIAIAQRSLTVATKPALPASLASLRSR